MTDHLMGAAKPIVEILGQPKTVRMSGSFPMADGTLAILEGPTECWIAALVYALSPEQKAVFAVMLKKMLEQREHQTGVGKAKVVAEIEMPNLKP